MVPEVGLEPTQGCPYQILSLARLPVSPLGLKNNKIYMGKNLSKNRDLLEVSIKEIISFCLFCERRQLLLL